MWSVLRQPWKPWTRAKATAFLATVAFAVGIGSTTAIYTVIKTVLLGPLPYAEGERFVALYGARFSEPNLRSSHSVADLLEYERRTTSFDVFGWFRLGALNLTSPGAPRHVRVVSVTPALAQHLGVNPSAGHWFTDETGAVISNRLWRQLGGDPAIVGQGMTLDGRRLTITGVMPARFHLPISGPGTEGFDTDVWIYLDPAGRGPRTEESMYFAYARRRPGVTLAQAEADVKQAAAAIAQLSPASHPSYTAILDDLLEASISRIRPTLLLLFAAAGLLLLITCANVAALLLARSVAHARETATRVALGAQQRQLAFHYFLEVLPVSLAGALGAVLASVLLVRVVVAIAAEYIPRADEIAVDWTVLLFAIATAFLASALSSVAPLWQAIRITPNEVLTAGVRASAGARARRLSQWLVVSEIALAFTLLAVSAVLVVHMRGLMRTSPGFNPDQLLTFRLTMAETIASDQAARVAYQQRLIDELESVPGVAAAAFANQLPLDGCCMGGAIYPEARATDPDAVERTSFVFATPGFFRTMQAPLEHGRLLDERDATADPVHVVINQAAAAHYWPGQNPIDALGHVNSTDGPGFRVVGVVRDIRNSGLGEPVVPEIYFPSAIFAFNPMLFVVRSPLLPDALIPEIRRAVRRVDPSLPVHDAMPMARVVQASLVLERVGSFMMTFFALAALLMATLGVYGVISYGVRQRTVEIGTRMALGATGREVLALVLGGALRMAAYGLAAGAVAVLGAAAFLRRFLETGDVGLSPFVASIGIIVAVVTLASSLPAWRATLLPPIVAIREESRSMWHSTGRHVRRAVQEVLHAVSAAADVPTVTEGTLLTEFVDAARRADSFAEAISAALATLCSRFGAESAMLLEKISPDQYQCSAAASGSPTFALPAHGFLLSRLKTFDAALALRSEELEALVRWARAHRPARVAELETLQTAGARLAVALRTRNEILGVLMLGPPVGRDEYSAAEKDVLRSCANQFALMVENARLTARVVEQEKLRRDLALAAEVQKRLLPEHPPETGIGALAAVSLPARTVGGDYYDFIDVGDHRIGIALADVAGKGVAAALIMSVVQASLRTIASEGNISLPQLASKMNSFLHRSAASTSYATFFYAQIDERNRQLRYVNAGHNPPYLLRSRGGIQELSTGGAVIGLFPQVSYQEATLDLESGDVLVAFTDGVIEALNAGEEEFGEERLKDLLRRLVDLPVQQISSAIAAELKNWIRGAPQYDDLTFIVLKVNQA